MYFSFPKHILWERLSWGLQNSSVDRSPKYLTQLRNTGLYQYCRSGGCRGMNFLLFIYYLSLVCDQENSSRIKKSLQTALGCFSLKLRFRLFYFPEVMNFNISELVRLFMY